MSNNHDITRLERSLAQVRAIRHVGGKIIDFLAQLEDFQEFFGMMRDGKGSFWTNETASRGSRLCAGRSLISGG